MCVCGGGGGHRGYKMDVRDRGSLTRLDSNCEIL